MKREEAAIEKRKIAYEFPVLLNAVNLYQPILSDHLIKKRRME